MRRQVFVGVVAIFAALLMVFPAWGQNGDDVPQPEAPPEGTNLPVQEVIFETTFPSEEGWPSESSPDEQISYEVTAEGYAVTSAAEGGIGSIPVVNLNIDNFYTEFTLTIDGCDSTASALLFFTRVLPSNATQTNDSFVYVNQCDGTYRARGLVDNSILDVAVSGQSMSLDEGATYTIGYLVSGNQSAWYINGQEIAQFEIPAGAARNSGALAPGAQLGISYTLSNWRIWALKNSGENVEDPASTTDPGGTDEAVSGDDPLQRGELGAIVYDPPFTAPTTIPLGLHHDVAAFLVGSDSVNLYNTASSGILTFEDVTGSNYYIQVDFQVRDCSETSTIGFVWHATEDFSSYDAFVVACDGSYEAYSVVDGVAGEPVTVGALNLALTDVQLASLGVYVDGSMVYLYAGGQLIESFTDDTLASGLAGLWLASGDDDTRMDILATELIVYSVPE